MVVETDRDVVEGAHEDTDVRAEVDIDGANIDTDVRAEVDIEGANMDKDVGADVDGIKMWKRVITGIRMCVRK